MKRIVLFLLMLSSICLLVVICAPHAKAAEPRNKYASIIVDADSMEILHARKIDSLRYPASLTKMMTLYLTFDAIERGDLALHEAMLISARASRAAPVKLNLRAGHSLTVSDAIQALSVHSANDAAEVLAERIGGSQEEFAVLMNAKAKALGMQRTIFKNANGLPNPDQYTTARDMAKLAEALLRNHKKYYPYFSQKTFTYNGRTYTNHNTLLGKVDGVDGFKTGFTNASGYNLVLSAKRDGRRLIAVVLGGASGRSRDKHMADLIERGFKVQKQVAEDRKAMTALYSDEITRFRPPSLTLNPKAQNGQVSAYTLRASHNIAGQATPATVRIVRGAGGMYIRAASAQQDWAVQIGAFGTAAAAQQANLLIKAKASLNLRAAQDQIIPVQRRTGVLYRARLGALTNAHANAVCKTLAQSAQACLVIAPK